MAIERILDRYDVTSRLGFGGMGDVWAADDLLLGRKVAIKFVGERELRENPGAEAILRDEARNAGRLLGHPNVVSVLDLIDVHTDIHNGPAVVLEYVKGCNLGEWIGTHRLKLDEFTQMHTALYIAGEVIEAISAAHKLDILHRDIKPQNVLCSIEGRIKVADFGLSRVAEAITRTHTVWGRHTPLYAAPEQWENEKPNHETDIYQLAGSLYHLFAGAPANRGDSLIGLLRWHQTDSLVPLQGLVPGLAAEFARLIDLALSNDRETRPDLWRIFDSISGATPRGSLRLSIDVENCDEASIRDIASLTDFGEDNLLEKRKAAVMFPHATEAVREAIGSTLLGAVCKLEDATR